MGGSNLLDRLLSSYRPKIWSKQWWWNLFSNGLNMFVVAAWRLHCQTNGKNFMTHLKFKKKNIHSCHEGWFGALQITKRGLTSSLMNDVVSYGTAISNTKKMLFV